MERFKLGLAIFLPLAFLVGVGMVAASVKGWDKVIGVLGAVGVALYSADYLHERFGRRRGLHPVKCRYTSTRKVSYEQAAELVQRTHSGDIINVSTTLPMEDVQSQLYKAVRDKLAARPEILCRRAIVYQDDEQFENVRAVLKVLGNFKNFSMSLLVGGVAIPSCIITDAGAIVGFNNSGGRLYRGLLIPAPSELIAALHDHYDRRISDPRFSIELKPVDTVLSDPSAIEQKIAAVKLEIESRYQQLFHDRKKALSPKAMLDGDAAIVAPKQAT